MSLYVISWSRDQRVMHREPLAEALHTNQAMLRGELTPNDYLIIWVGTEEDSDAALAQFQPLVLGYRALDQARSR